ncbi:MAG: TonB-dependent receptor [Cyclobacteriaceae bacterium]|nr:TonB-dependent receptor [Cyclobacteriaceae bacterium]
MNKGVTLIILGILLSTPLEAQILTVKDLANARPITNVTIESALSLIIKTDTAGKADIGTFKQEDEIWFIHPDYMVRQFSYAKLVEMNFMVTLAENSYSLGEIVVSANKFNEKLSEVGQSIRVVNAKEISFLNQQTTPDLLQSSGNVFVQKSQMGGGSPVIRGFETNKVLMVVDGVRMNNAIYRGGHLQNSLTLDNNALERLEIILGPGSVIYGSDALGGVMHFYSKNPKLSDNDTLEIQTQLLTRYASANNAKTTHLDFNFGLKKFAALSSLSFSDFGDLRQGGRRDPQYPDFGKRLFYVDRINNQDVVLPNSNTNIQKKSGYRQYDFLQKFLYRQNDVVNHVLNFQYSTSSDIPRYDRLTQIKNDAPQYAEWLYGPQERFFSSYQLNLAQNRKWFDQAKIILGYQFIEESRHTRSFNNSFLKNRNEQLNIYTLNADFEKKKLKNTLRYGFDFWHNKVRSTAHQQNIITLDQIPLDTRYPDGGSTMGSCAFYFTHSYKLNDQWILSEGLRINYIALQAHFDDKTFFPFDFDQVNQSHIALNGNLSLVYNSKNNWRVMLAGSSGFRGPNIDDLSKVFDSSPGNVVVPNPELAPEYTYNLELGISKRWLGKIHLGLNTYYTWYQNAITMQKVTAEDNQTSSPLTESDESLVLYDEILSEAYHNANVKKAFIYGFSGLLNVDLTHQLKFNHSMTYTYGRIVNDPGRSPLDHISPLFGRSSIDLQIKKFTGSFFMVFNGDKKSKDYNLSGEDNELFSVDPINGFMPKWVTLNLNTFYSLNEQIQFQLSFNNILDTNYRQFASNISAGGRNISLTIRGSF